MTEHQHHGHGKYQGGHEIDAPPTRELFNIIWGLSALTLLSLVTCVQLFNDQARDISVERGKEGSALLASYRKEMETRTRGAGEDVITDASGKVLARYNYIPLASARDLILAKPEKLGAFPPPPGWIHPDDVAAGGQGAGHAVPPPPPAPVQVPAAPGEQPAGAVPDPNAPTGPGTPAEPSAPGMPPAGAAADGDQPVAAPADPAAPAAAPAEPAPAPAPSH